MDYTFEAWKLIPLFFFTMMKFIPEGMTEGFTWMNPIRRLINKWIYSEYAKAHGKDVKGRFGYHSWRYTEDGGWVFSVMLCLPDWNYRIVFAGFLLIGIFVYERAMGIARYGEWFPEKSPHRIGKWITIPHPIWLDFVLLIGGILLSVWFYLK